MVGLFASDLDGTLLGATHRVSRPVLRAIRAATDSGRHFAVATGRVMRSPGGFGFGGVPIEAVCANGAIVLGRDGSVHQVAVYGDGGNAVDMLRRFSRSYAPAGAMPEGKGVRLAHPGLQRALRGASPRDGDRVRRGNDRKGLGRGREGHPSAWCSCGWVPVRLSSMRYREIPKSPRCASRSAAGVKR